MLSFIDPERHVPTAEAEARAGKVLIWKEGVTGHVLFGNLPAKALAQSLREGAGRRWRDRKSQ